MTYPRVSIVVPVYNVEKYLRECIDSILSQKGNITYEVILVNDGSTDNCGAICNEYAGKYAHIRVLYQKNSGLPAARNAGLSLVRGDYVLFVDSDDFLDSNLLEVCFSYINDIQQPDMLQFAYTYTTDGGEPTEKVRGPLCTNLFQDGEEYGDKKNFRPFAWSYLIKKSLLDEHFLHFSEELRFAEDVHFTLRCLFFARNIQTIARPLYYYRQRSGSLMAQKASYTIAWYHIHIAEMLIDSFHQEKGNRFSTFFKKRVHQLVVVYLKGLAKLEYDKSTMMKAQQDLKHFNEVCREKPNCITGGFTLSCANLYLPGYIAWRKLTHIF